MQKILKLAVIAPALLGSAPLLVQENSTSEKISMVGFVQDAVSADWR